MPLRFPVRLLLCLLIGAVALALPARATVTCPVNGEDRQWPELPAEALAPLDGLSAVGRLGNPDGPVSVVEFSEYSCPACRAAQPRVQAALERHGDIRLYSVEYPIFGRGWFANGFSDLASRVAVLAIERGKFADFHAAMFAPKGRYNKARVYQAAQEVGISLTEVRAAAKDDALKARIDEGIAFGESLGVKGTPYFLIGRVLVRGWPGQAVADCLIDHARTAAVR